MKDEAVDVVGEVGEADLRLGTDDADGADEKAHLILLPGKDMLDAGAHGGALRVGAGRARRHRLAPRLLAVDATDPACRLQPGFVGPTAISGVCPYIGGGVVAGLPRRAACARRSAHRR